METEESEYYCIPSNISPFGRNQSVGWIRLAPLQTCEVVLDARENFVERNLSAIVKWGGF